MVDPFVGFLVVSAVVIVTPGPDTVLTIRNTLVGGRRGGAFTALGVASGQAIWTLATSVGIAALLIAWRPAFLAIQLAGGVYLAVLGLQSLIRAFRSSGPATNVPAASARTVGPSAAYRQGLISNLGNPKMAVFFASLLPQFTPGGQPSFGGLLVLGLLFCLLTLTWLTLYSVVLAKAGDVLRRPRVHRAVETVSGVALLGMGIRVALTTRS